MPVAPSPQVSPTAVSSNSSGLLPWLLGLAALLIAGGAFLFLRRRPEVEPAPIEPPIVQRNTQDATSVVPAGDTEPEGEALAMQVEAIRLSRSFMNVTVDYRVTLRNRLGRALENATVEADLVSASNDRPLANQLAARDTALPTRHSVVRLGPGQSQRFEGKLQLPLAQAAIIQQGAVGVLVPLLRARASAGNATPLAKTYVIGQGAPGATRPQPFRIDEPPRSYEPLIQRALD